MGPNRELATKPDHVNRVRIVDLAEYLNLTKGTVSRALNGYADISNSTRTRVRNAADELGYRPLSHAQAIKTGRVRSIGLVLQVYEHDGHSPFVADFLAGLSEAASREDWTMTVASASSDKDTLRLLRELTADKKADGFILPRSKLNDPRIAFLREQNIPFVLYGRTEDEAGCAWFDIESETAMEEAVGQLVTLGHRRIGFVPGAPGYTYSQLRLSGYKAGLANAGLALDPALIAKPAYTRDHGAVSLRDLLDTHDDVTAILCSLDHAALGAYDVARERGLRIGKDISIISYDGIPESALVSPPLSTFSVDTRRAGQQLASTLIRFCRGEAPEHLRALGRATFLNRDSHGPAPPR